jgi:hypothetical protein
MKKVCILTLTHDLSGREKSLEDTINSFGKNYIGPKIDWYILCNGKNKDIDNTVEKLIEKWKNNFNFEYQSLDINLGVGVGLNILNKKALDYEYSFLLEGDWINMPHYVSGHDVNWFWNSVKFLDDNKDIQHIQYRKFIDDVEDRQYGIGFRILESNVIDKVGDYLILKDWEYGNNPSLRRNSFFWEVGIFPLQEFFDEYGSPIELKESTHWGQAEIVASQYKNIKSAWIFLGNFIHHEFWNFSDDWESWKKRDFGCKKYDMAGWNVCKYGYLFPNHYFCGACKKNSNFTDLERHSHQYVDEILPLQHSFVDHKIISEKIKSINKEPTIDPDEYINPDVWLNNRYIRN